MASEAGITLTTKVGEPFEVRLRARLTSGFSWQALYDPDALEFLDRRTVHGNQAVGASGEEILRFRAKRFGEHSLHFALGRPWDKGPHECVTYTVAAAE